MDRSLRARQQFTGNGFRAEVGNGCPAYSYAAPVPVPPDASALDALVAALGRNPVSGTIASNLLGHADPYSENA